MNKKLIVFFVVFSCFSMVYGRELPKFNEFLQVLGQLESGNNDFAVGDNGKAIGRYQIWRVCYQDAKEFDKTIKFSYESLTNKENSAQIVKAYISRYCKENDWESWARAHNSGPAWKKKKHLTNNYWNKFKKIAGI